MCGGWIKSSAWCKECDVIRDHHYFHHNLIYHTLEAWYISCIYSVAHIQDLVAYESHARCVTIVSLSRMRCCSLVLLYLAIQLLNKGPTWVTHIQQQIYTLICRKFFLNRFRQYLRFLIRKKTNSSTTLLQVCLIRALEYVFTNKGTLAVEVCADCVDHYST